MIDIGNTIGDTISDVIGVAIGGIPQVIEWATEKAKGQQKNDPVANVIDKGIEKGTAIVKENSNQINKFIQGAKGLILSPWIDDVTNALRGIRDGSGSGFGSGSGEGSGEGSGSGSGDFWRQPSYRGAAKLVNDTAMSNNEWSAYQAQLDREWQEYMSNTAHQREVADLKAAGLNPVLSAGGNGASTPSGAMGQTDTSNTRIVGDLAMMALSAANHSASAIDKLSGDNVLSAYMKKFANTAAMSFARGIGRKAAFKF